MIFKPSAEAILRMVFICTGIRISSKKLYIFVHNI